MSWLQQRPWVAQTRFDTPLGPVTAAATARGLGGVWFDGQAHHPGPLSAPEQPGQRWLAQASDELSAYWLDGHTAHFCVPLDAGGTAFQQAVWQALRTIPAGHTDRYGEIAARLGRPAAARAVGAAVGRNPVSIIVPCHRVLGRQGALTGYAGGLDRKRDLLRREGAAF
ncbi:MAG: methylated-DNA--[protein]-cysteine S-methyltransferase [Vitreoscilla sp.]|jgi:methylated-DNA-[protein]-cysteine S-methyltransferase|nr:methylated-DNA--[protein]-cysteine S-methyltransferase [Burkholderiales bacterium]MBP6339321.1 methylated-DNA--[protein]-cysteine S-methyltransferase [Vitreoscilla sp.]MBP6677082.1 methylated-DNA--[protein]-cysteine S-methyltransferase [Vitreoscilla sp.]